MTTGSADEIRAIKEAYPNVDWARFEDIDRALNWELWHGPLPDDYWTDVEPLDHYEWQGFEQAVKDIEEVLEPLPHEVWVDNDCDPPFVSETDPEDDDANWEIDPDGESPDVWIGGENWSKINVRETVMHHETWKQVF